jgi:membrane-associated HD superfamily phosphohydrolase
MIESNIVSRSKIIVEQRFSLTEQRLKVLAKPWHYRPSRRWNCHVMCVMYVIFHIIIKTRKQEPQLRLKALSEKPKMAPHQEPENGSS